MRTDGGLFAGIFGRGGVRAGDEAWLQAMLDTEAALARVLERAGLARQKWPEEIHPVDDFPRTPSGKVRKYVLRADVAARH